MALMSRPASTTYAALTYVTIGALMDVWSGVWYWYLTEYAPEGRLPYYFCCGFFLTGSVLLIIGLAVGQIGRSARVAELPPVEAAPAVARTDQEAARHPPAVVAGATPIAAPMMTPVAAPMTTSVAAPMLSPLPANRVR